MYGRYFDPNKIFETDPQNYKKIMNNHDEEFLPNKYVTFQGKKMKIYFNM